MNHRKIVAGCTLALCAAAAIAVTAQTVRITGTPKATGTSQGQQSEPRPTQVGKTPGGGPPTPQYDIGQMWKKMNALAEEVEALKKQNQSLAAKLQQLQQSQQSLAQSATAIKQLDAEYRSHTHFLPNIGQTALSALPGMQEIANKSGVGHYKGQWDTIRVLWVTGNQGVAAVGTPIQLK